MHSRIERYRISESLENYRNSNRFANNAGKLEHTEYVDLLTSISNVRDNEYLTDAEISKLFAYYWNKITLTYEDGLCVGYGITTSDIPIDNIIWVLLRSFNIRNSALEILKNKHVESSLPLLFDHPIFIGDMTEIIATLYNKTGDNATLVTKENIAKIFRSLQTRQFRKSDYLGALNLILIYLQNGGLLNQSNFDYLLDKENTVEIEHIRNLLAKTERREHPLTYRLFIQFLNEVENNLHQIGKLENLFSYILAEEGHGYDDSQRFSINIQYIINHYDKIPSPVIYSMSDIPRHLCNMDLFRRLVDIARDARHGNNQANIANAMDAHIQQLIGLNQRNGADINYDQSVHNQFVESSILTSLARLKQTYKTALEPEAFKKHIKELRQFSKSLDKKSRERFAGDAIDRILDTSDINAYTKQGVTTKQALVLVWVAMHDKRKYHPQVNFETAKDNFIQSMIRIERAYNINTDEHDNGRAKSLNSCPGGTFNMTVAALNTVHTDIEVVFNSSELASRRLQQIIKSEINKYLTAHPNLDAAVKSTPLIEIEELKSNIENTFKSDIDNTAFHGALDCLNSLTIDSMTIRSSVPDSNVDQPEVFVAIEDNINLNRDNFILRAFKSVANYFKRVLEPVRLNPFFLVMYNEENEPGAASHPLPHTRTLHTSFRQKMLDAYQVLAGGTFMSPPSPTTKMGMLDYFPFGPFKLLEFMLWENRNEYLYVMFALPTLLIKTILAVLIFPIIFPIIALTHLASKIAYAIEKRRVMKIPTQGADSSNSTTTIKQMFKENLLPDFSNDNNVSTGIAPQSPTEVKHKTRRFVFGANYTLQYVSALFSQTKRRDIDHCRTIGRVNRRACHELQRAHLLTYRQVR